MKHLGIVSRKPKLAQEDMSLLDIANAVSSVIKGVWWMVLMNGVVKTVSEVFGQVSAAPYTGNEG